VWWAQYFSCWMTELVHTPPDPMAQAISLAELRTVISRPGAQMLLAENYVGLSAPSPTGPLPLGSLAQLA
jgi:p-hydroxybenzoate 3-monooxygenase